MSLVSCPKCKQMNRTQHGEIYLKCSLCEIHYCKECKMKQPKHKKNCTKYDGDEPQILGNFRFLQRLIYVKNHTL